MADVSVAWLSNDVLLLVTDDREGGALDVGMINRGERLSVEMRSLDLGASVLHALVLPEGVRRNRGWESMSISGETDERLTRDQVNSMATDLKAFLRAHLAPLDATTRNRITDFIASATAPAATHTLSKALVEVRDVLRERLPAQVNSPDAAQGLAVDHILSVNDSSFYIKGWAYDEESEIVRLTAVSPEGSRIEMLDRLFRYPRPDVNEWSNSFGTDADSGFVCFVDLGVPSSRPTPWIFEMENADGLVGEATGPSTLREMTDVRDHILHDFAGDRVLDDQLMEDHVSPAMMRLQEDIHSAIEIAKVTQYGTAPESPDISIVVPVYKNIDHLEAQLAEFADDPAIHEADLIYVLDSPEAADAFDYLASHLYPIYLVPFRIRLPR